MVQFLKKGGYMDKYDKYDMEEIRFTLRIPRFVRDKIQDECDRSLLKTSMNNWILGHLLKAVSK